MIKVTARARAISSFTHFAFSMSFKMESGTARRRVVFGLLDPQHTARAPPQAVMDLRSSQSGGDKNTNPNRRQDAEYTTRRAGPQCVLKNKHTR